jgi:putative ABC transport system ATP-binding protein
MIDLKQLHKSYYTESIALHVLKGICLHIDEGEYVSVMGASGSGKSTLLNILGILDTYDSSKRSLAAFVSSPLTVKMI